MRWLLVAVTAFGSAYTLAFVGAQVRSPESRSDDVAAIARAAKDASPRADGVIFVPSSRRAWLLAPSGSLGIADLALKKDPRSSNSLYGVELSAEKIREQMLTAERIIVLRDPALESLENTPQEEVKRAVLHDHFKECSSKLVNKAHIAVYARAGRC